MSREKAHLNKFVGYCFQEEQAAQGIQIEVSIVPWKRKRQPSLDYLSEDSVAKKNEKKNQKMSSIHRELEKPVPKEYLKRC